MNIIDKIIVSFKARETRSTVLGIPDNDKIFTRIAAVILILTLCALAVFSYFNYWSDLGRNHLFELTSELISKWNSNFPKIPIPIPNNFELIFALNVLLNNAILVLAYLFLIKNLNVKIKWSLVTALFLLVPLSVNYLYYVTFGTPYCLFIAALFFYLGIFLRLINFEGKLVFIRKTVFLFVFISILIGIAAGIRAFFAFNIPLLLASLYMYYKKNNRPIILSSVSFVAGLIGHIVNSIFNFWYSFSFFDHAKIDLLYINLLPKFGDCLVNIAGFFGFTHFSPLISIGGFFSIAALIAAGFIVWFVYKSLRKARSENPPHFISIFFAVSLVFNIFILIITSTYIMPKYFLPFMILYVPLCARFFEHAESNYEIKKRIIVISLIILLVIGKGCFNFFGLI